MTLRAYALVTGAYWSFTITDGALRMLVLLYFNELGYGPVTLASLFLIYELFGVFTNLIGGWLGSRFGLKSTLLAGLALQIVVLLALSAVGEDWTQWIAVAWVASVQSLSGIAKDLTKMSAKTAVKFIAPEGRLFGLVAALTGSKNSLKGVGYFVGAALLEWLGFGAGLVVLAVLLSIALVVTALGVSDFGQPKQQKPLSTVLQKSPAIRRLSLARFFLFGSRDIWFVVALPVFFDRVLGWSHPEIGTFLALWLIGYGVMQSVAPRWRPASRVTASAASTFLPPMAAVVILIATAVWANRLDAVITIIGLAGFGVMFAFTSAVHSYLILAYSASDADAPTDVGFYYSANAAGRLVGTLLSGVLFWLGGTAAAFLGTATFLVLAYLVSLGLPPIPSASGAAEASPRQQHQAKTEP